MNREWHRGEIILLKRPAADLIGVVEEVDEEEERLTIRMMDHLPNDKGMVVDEDAVLWLAREQERELPLDFLEAIENQRKVVFTEKARRSRVGRLVREIQDDGEKGEEVWEVIMGILND